MTSATLRLTVPAAAFLAVAALAWVLLPAPDGPPAPTTLGAERTAILSLAARSSETMSWKVMLDVGKDPAGFPGFLRIPHRFAAPSDQRDSTLDLHTELTTPHGILFKAHASNRIRGEFWSVGEPSAREYVKDAALRPGQNEVTITLRFVVSDAAPLRNAVQEVRAGPPYLEYDAERVERAESAARLFAATGAGLAAAAVAGAATFVQRRR